MLYDPKWEKTETKADVYSVASLVAWLEKQPPDKSYDWYSVTGCLVCNYLTDATGNKTPWHNDEDKSYKTVFPNGPAYHFVGGREPWTYGAALERARTLAS